MAFATVPDWRSSNQPEPSACSYAAGFLLAGGKSSRMGQDKALLRLGGETLAERALRKLRAVCPEVAIAGGATQLHRFGRVIPDDRPNCGPLGGIVAALEQSRHQWNLFIPVDVPYLPEIALRTLLFVSGGRAWCTLAQAGEQVHPLCAVFSREALPVLRAELEAGQLRVRRAAEATLSISYPQFAEEHWFANLNTPEAFAEAERKLKSKAEAEILAAPE